DMDDMEADLFGISKPSPRPGKMTVKGPGKCDSTGGAMKTTEKLLSPKKGESAPLMKKPLASPPAARQYKKVNFEDIDNPLAGFLSDEEQDVPKKPTPTGTKSNSEKKAEVSKEKEPLPPQTPLHTVAPAPTREKLVFEEDGDDLMDALGFGDRPKGDEKQEKEAEEEEPRPARSKLDELLGRSSVARVLEQPIMGEVREFQMDKKYQKQPEKEEVWDEEDFVFGSYKPTMASTPEDRPVRRQSVSRFSAENSSRRKLEPNSKPPPPVSRSPVQGSRAGGDWLGLKDEGFMDSEPSSPVKTSPATAGRPGPTSQLLSIEETAAKATPAEEENWLSAALSRKKAQAQAKAQEGSAEPLRVPGKELDPLSPVSQPAASTEAPQQTAASQNKAANTNDSGQPIPWLSTTKQAPAQPLDAAKGDPSRDTSALVPMALFPGEQEMQGPTLLAQVSLLVPCPQEMHFILKDESPAQGLLQERRLEGPTVQLCQDVTRCQAALLSAQARVAELENQVQMLELERTQNKLLLENLQQRHQEDLDMLENSHRNWVKVLEETYRQREQRLWQEKEQLAAQLLSQSRDAEQARAELQEQHQQRLVALEQQNTLELERLRELQRVSVQEMHKDHEEQLQRLKQLKDQEIAAVTSTTSHTRSLNGVIEQMEKFSSNLHDLSHKVEATHHTTSQELAMGARQRDQQLKVLQDRLSQQQRDMEDERSRLQEVITRMEARLSEQTRLLEQERWRATAEQSKVESLQRSLEEQRRIMTQQLSMERAELERAKSSLLEEQKSVMQKCSEERRKLAAEWAEFHAQQRLSKERMEREMERALQMDSQREGTIMSLAKEQTELKILGCELKAKEEQLVRERELLEEARQELRLEKEKLNRAALRMRQREEEMESTTKLSSQKFKEGEQALREACRIESEHQSRLQVMQQRLEQLKQQEQCLQQQERLSMGHQRRQLEQLRKELPSNPTMMLAADQDLKASAKGFFSTLYFPPPDRMLFPWRSPEASRETMASPTELYTTLLLLKHRAHQDRDFLEDERFFLETLTKAS
ncbi:FBF1 factor, partial [Turnix velox]|nr:FBF1 factor [Turnix velox]